MGIDAAGAQFLYAARSAGIDFSNTATLGRQSFHPGEPGLRPVARALGIPGGAAALIADCEGVGDRYLELLGARSVTSFDVSAFEHASVVHDLNDPLPSEYHGKFSAVLDGGTIEHVFDIAQALRNCLEMVRPGGHFLAIQSGNNFLGHGFYQVSQEFYLRTLTPENGFDLLAVLFCQVDPPVFYGVRDPQVMRRRFEVVNDFPTYTLAIAQRTGRQRVFQNHPQQSDYAENWPGARDLSLHAAAPGAALGRRGPTRSALRSVLPKRLRRFAGRVVRRARRARRADGLGQAAFYRLSLERLLRGEFSEPQADRHPRRRGSGASPPR